MTAFVLAAAALTLATVLLVALPLVRRAVRARGATQAEASIAVLRDQLADLERDLENGTLARDAYEAAQRELKRRILDDSAPEPAPADQPQFGATLALALSVPLAALLLYAWLGNPAALDPQARQAAQPHPDAAQFEAMVEKLAARLKNAPGDAEGWLMLARSYRALGRHAEAAAAFGRTEARIASDAGLLTEWAESTAMASRGTLAGRPAELLARALAIDPEHGHALALAGAAAFEREDWKGALAHWERLASRLQQDSPEAEMVTRSIAAARGKLGLAAPAKSDLAAAKPGSAPAAGPQKAPPAASAQSAPSPAAATTQARVAGRVSLAPALAAKAAPSDTVFIFARAAGGPPAPLAVLRKQVKDLPAEFSLDDTMAMAPTMRISGFPEVIVGARVSKTGNAIPQSGDLQGLTRPVKVGATGIALVIDSALP